MCIGPDIVTVNPTQLWFRRICFGNFVVKDATNIKKFHKIIKIVQSDRQVNTIFIPQELYKAQKIDRNHLKKTDYIQKRSIQVYGRQMN